MLGRARSRSGRRAGAAAPGDRCGDRRLPPVAIQRPSPPLLSEAEDKEGKQGEGAREESAQEKRIGVTDQN